MMVIWGTDLGHCILDETRCVFSNAVGEIEAGDFGSESGTEFGEFDVGGLGHCFRGIGRHLEK